MPFQARDISIPPVPDWLQRGAGAITQYIPDIFAPGDPYLPGTMLLPEYMKDWAQGETVDPSEMMFESLTNQMGGGQPLAQIAERSGAKNLGAFLHRTMDPEELEGWLRRFDRGARPEVATSVITPNYRPFYHQEFDLPGVIFSVEDPRNVRWMAPVDRGSARRSLSERALDNLQQARYDMLHNAYNNPNFKPGTAQDILYPGGPFKFRDIAAEGSRLSRILDAEDKLMERRYLGLDAERIIPHGEAYYPGREDVSLADVLKKQYDFLSDLAKKDPNMEKTAYHTLLNEVGYRVNPAEIAGVRLPRGVGPQYEQMLDLAEKHKLPIWQFSPQTRPAEVTQGLQDFLSGSTHRWYDLEQPGWPPGIIESTADPLAKYFGREPPVPAWKLPGYRGLEGIEHLPPIELPAVNPFMYME